MTSVTSSLSFSNSQVIPWDDIDPQWMTKLKNAIATDTPPSYLLFPESQETLGEVVQQAAQSQLPLLPCGNGTKLNWGGLVNTPQWVISTQKLNRVIEHAVGDLTVTVESGVKLADIQAILKPYRQFLPIDPAYPDSATLGGIVATSDSGCWRQRYGSVKDLVLGISFVRSDGKIAKAGGRVVKNVAGYDMMKLLTGSYGTLGIISQLTFRLYPMLEASATLLMTGDKEAIATTTQTLRNSSLTPTAAEVLSSQLVQKLGMGDKMGLILRFQSIEASIKEQTTQVKAIADQLGLEVTTYSDNPEDTLWKQLPEIINNSPTEATMTAKIGIIPAQMVNFLDQLQGLAMINLGSGLGKLRLEGEELTQVGKVRSLLESHRGYLTILTAPMSLKQQYEPWGYQGNALELMKTIKQKFDPHSIFSPGRFFGDL